MIEPEGCAPQLRCPYHGWTYSLEGELKGTPDFNDVCNFVRANNGLVPVEVAAWENWVFVRLSGEQNNSGRATAVAESELGKQIESLNFGDLHWFERRRYELKCNWKVFVDNYLDGGYHVPHLHKGLDSVLDYSNYTIENGERYCLQSSPMVADGDGEIGVVRSGQRALYYWLYPNFMINYYEGTLDTNLVRPLAIDRTEVIFDFYFTDVSAAAHERNLASVTVGDRIQREDLDICESVQRGLNSRAYQAGRLSVRREAGEHLFSSFAARGPVVRSPTVRQGMQRIQIDRIDRINKIKRQMSAHALFQSCQSCKSCLICILSHALPHGRASDTTCLS
jgi:choline monooxygenase